MPTNNRYFLIYIYTYRYFKGITLHVNIKQN